VVVGNLHKLEWVGADGCHSGDTGIRKESESKEHIGI
jgi:hypothetical protein